MPRTGQEAEAPPADDSGPHRHRVSPEVQEQIKLLAKNGFKIDEIVKQTGLPRATVGAYAADFRKTQREIGEVTQRVFRQERTPERLMDILSSVPGIGEGKVESARMLVMSNPLLITHPQELYSMLTQGMNMNHWFADQVVKGFFRDMYETNPQLAAMPMYGPGFPGPGFGGGYGNPYGAMGGGPPQMQQVQTPMGPVYVPVPMASQASQAQLQVPETEYVEEVEPVLVNGQPVKDSDGHVVMRTRRRPAAMAAQDDQFQKTLLMLNQLGVIGGGRNSGPDPTTQAMLVQMQQAQGQLLAELSAERARRTEAQHWGEVVQGKDNKLMDLTLQAAKAGAGMPPETAVQMKTIEGMFTAFRDIADRQERRMDRIERLAGPALKSVLERQGGTVPSATGQPVPVPFSDADAQRIVQAGQAIDAQEQG